jgi:hypothetical protein
MRAIIELKPNGPLSLSTWDGVALKQSEGPVNVPWKTWEKIRDGGDPVQLVRSIIEPGDPIEVEPIEPEPELVPVEKEVAAVELELEPVKEEEPMFEPEPEPKPTEEILEEVEAVEGEVEIVSDLMLDDMVEAAAPVNVIEPEPEVIATGSSWITAEEPVASENIPSPPPKKKAKKGRRGK